jgi:hypothetical protein
MLKVCEKPRHDVCLGSLGIRLTFDLSLFMSKAESSAWDALECSGADQREQDQASIQEVVSLHEAGFMVRIQAPATETFELQVHCHRRPLSSMPTGFRGFQSKKPFHVS